VLALVLCALYRRWGTLVLTVVAIALADWFATGIKALVVRARPCVIRNRRRSSRFRTMRRSRRDTPPRASRRRRCSRSPFRAWRLRCSSSPPPLLSHVSMSASTTPSTSSAVPYWARWSLQLFAGS
jgi:hypothetical protein